MLLHVVALVEYQQRKHSQRRHFTAVQPIQQNLRRQNQYVVHFDCSFQRQIRHLISRYRLTSVARLQILDELLELLIHKCLSWNEECNLGLVLERRRIQTTLYAHNNIFAYTVKI